MWGIISGQDGSEPGRRGHHGSLDFLEVHTFWGGVNHRAGLQDCPGDPPRQSRGSSRVRKGQKGTYLLAVYSEKGE